MESLISTSLILKTNDHDNFVTFIAKAKTSLMALVFSINSLGIPSSPYFPYFAPRHAPTMINVEQLHPPASIT